jgi:hypothetical protein
LECGVAFANCGRAVAHIRGSHMKPAKSAADFLMEQPNPG